MQADPTNDFTLPVIPDNEKFGGEVSFQANKEPIPGSTMTKERILPALQMTGTEFDDLANTKENRQALGMAALVGYKGGLSTISEDILISLTTKAVNATGLITLGKGGKLWKTIKFPKFLTNGIRKKQAKPAASFLLDFAGYAWRSLGYKSYAPARFVRGIITHLKLKSGVDTTKTFDKVGLQRVLGYLSATFPAIIKNFFYAKTLGANKKAKQALIAKTAAANRLSYRQMIAAMKDPKNTMAETLITTALRQTVIPAAASVDPTAFGATLAGEVSDKAAKPINVTDKMKSKRRGVIFLNNELRQIPTNIASGAGVPDFVPQVAAPQPPPQPQPLPQPVDQAMNEVPMAPQQPVSMYNKMTL